MQSSSTQAPRYWVTPPTLARAALPTQWMDSNANYLFQKHHLRNTHSQCHRKFIIAATIDKGHSKEGSLLRTQRLVLLRHGVDSGCGHPRQEAELPHAVWVRTQHSIWGSYGINETMQGEGLALDLACSWSSTRGPFLSFPLCSRRLQDSSFLRLLLFLQQEGKKEGPDIYLRSPMNCNIPKLLSRSAQEGQLEG